ncbi:MAG: bifunctional methylenetetrahydrofolate dehydrogenase/methenyltetrahydrofolate cyclohydrolase FolD [Alphaproteobacteria bacterium]|nr:bifunctional methylenetetrahydrofolate dehydrogenase/methenyltetrahydrofolate cyclohydrolase FolD [Alphaproteobacteria bacterium]
MTAKIINGTEIAKNIRHSLKEKISLLKTPPVLAVILAGSDPASEIYVKNKEKACHEVGITARTHKFSANVSEKELLDLLNDLNRAPDINGILVQLPLPAHINSEKILQAVSPAKDVDGFHPLNIGMLQQKSPDTFIPCTPKGIICLLHSLSLNLTGLNAIVIGRSQIVGLPVSNLLLQENCTVTVTHSKTKKLSALCRSADILIAALGKPEFITKEYIKPGAIIIDVGINRTPNGLKGDVNFKDALETAAYVTPVPGGVGPMTIAMLLENTYEAFLKQNRP